MSSSEQGVNAVPEIDLNDPRVVADPFAAYGSVRERSPVAQLRIPGGDPIWLITQHEAARAMLGDPRFELNIGSFVRTGIPEDCLPYMRTMSEIDGPEHTRLRKLVAPAFTARHSTEFRPRIEQITEGLLNQLPEHGTADPIDLLAHVAQPLSIEVIRELVGVPADDSDSWRHHSATLAAGPGPEFAHAIRGIVDAAHTAITRRRAEPGNDLLSDLIEVHAADGDRLSETELVTMVIHLVVAGQENPANFIANATAALLCHPDQLAALQADPGLMGQAVDELMRWCGPSLLTAIRYAREEFTFYGTVIRKGEAVTAAIASANHDPRAFAESHQLDIGHAATRSGQLGFGHGPHYCLGAQLAQVEAETALTALLRRYPNLALAVSPDQLRHAPNPGSWRLEELPVNLHI